ncbi:efflux RND transporter periplasmic adaptor subunit [Roseovarius amoyensis]|uniref:efflux RND transporter periplasmic adaptor subunit n=1 Tax=Roseovarius amoyensis TaxID=2211448 RepID=UPI000DBE9CB9|nr:efflux RND transporter periplasmic adaptor subunit [Roseovarius amoyensis]
MAVWKQFLLLCLLGALAYGGQALYSEYGPAPQVTATAPQARPAAVELEPATTRTLSRTVEAVGTTRARLSVDIVPQADGRLVEIAITPGAQVEKGQVLARLDDVIERADLAEAEARENETARALERARQLLGSNAISQATLEDSIARLAEARAQLDRARQRLQDRTITAPFAGVVGLAEIDPGARVSAGDVLARLDDLDDVIVEFALPETLFAEARVGLRISAASAAFPGRSFDGHIAAVDTHIDQVSRAFRARAVIPNPDRALPAGMFMSLTLTLSEAEKLVVPEAAILFQAAETYVFTVEDGIARRMPVTTGLRKNGVVAIESGIEPGTPVIVRGLQRVRDGQPVTVLGDSALTEGDS